MKKEKQRDTFLLAGLKGVLAGYIVLAVLLGITTLLVSSGHIPEAGMTWGALTCALISVAVGACFAAARFGVKRLILGLSVAGVMFLITIISRLLISAAGFPDGWTLFQLIFFAAGGLGGSFLSLVKLPVKRLRR